MAKKKQAETHSQRLSDALNSIYTASTPISSILPVQETIRVSETASLKRGEGARSSGVSTMPQKLLLQITDPGRAPSAPKAVANPGTLASPNFAAYLPKGQMPLSFGKKGWNTKAKTYGVDIAMFNNAVSRYNNYLNAQTRYTSDLSRYNTAVAQRAADIRVNTTREKNYQRDLQRFLATSGKTKTSKKRAARSKGSRSGSVSRSAKGSR